MPPTLVRTRGRSFKLSHEGYQYLKRHKLKSGLQTWRCAREYCRAQAFTQISTGEVVRTTDDLHDHWPVPERIEVDRVLTEMKRRAEDTHDSPSALINFVLQSVSTCVLPHLPPPAALERIIERHRKSRTKDPEVVDPRTPIDPPIEFRVSKCANKEAKDPLLMDTGENDPNRIMIFGRKKTSQGMSFVRKLYVDTTFNQAPSPFAQVLVVVAERAIYTLPVAYVLLTDRTSDSYARMFTLLKDAWPALDPRAVIISFDRGLLDGARACFPLETCFQGRFCELLDSIRLRIVGAGLWPRYKKGGDFSLKTRMIAALAFVAPSELSSALSELEVAVPEELAPVLRAFQENFIGGLNIRLPDGTPTTKEPQFPIEVWSNYQRALDGEDWVADHAKETRRRLSVDLCNGKPTLSEFIEAIKNELRYVDYERERYNVGYAPPERKLTAADQRIIGTVREAGKKPHLEYLMTIARNFTIKA